MDDTNFLAQVRQMLGLDEAADAEAILLALQAALSGSERSPDPREFVPVKAFEDMLRTAGNEARKSRLDRVEAKVERAWQEGYFTAAGREWARELCLSDETAFDRFIETNEPMYAHLSREFTWLAGKPPARAQDAPGDVGVLCSQLGISPDKLSDR